jgi:hypothetical protein
VPHFARVAIALVFTLAVRWVGRLSERERLVLATNAVVARGRVDEEALPPVLGGRDETSRPWQEITGVLWQADFLQRALVRHVIDHAGPDVDLEELREPGMRLAEALHDAGVLLRGMRTQDDPDYSWDEDPMALDEVMGQRRRHVTLEELRRARDLGLVREFVDDMNHRADSWNGSTASPRDRWQVRWTATGRFTATAGSSRVEGWAAHPAAVADELSSWSTPPQPGDVSWCGGQPAPPEKLCSSERALPELSLEHAMERFWADRDRLGEVLAALEELRGSCPAPEIPDLVAARAAELQRREPQLPDIAREMHEQRGSWSMTMAAEWVRTQAVVNTADPVWGEFDRFEIERTARWVPDKTRELLRVPDLAPFLAQHFVGRYDGAPVQLLRIPGPAGPLYVLGSGGSHRTHLSRILGLSWLFAETTLVSVPRRVHSVHVTPEGGPEACRATVRLWQGCLDRQIITGRLEGQDWIVDLRLDQALAPWVVLPAELAVAYNQRYELLYPGALEAIGIPPGVYDSTQTWHRWLLAT